MKLCILSIVCICIGFAFQKSQWISLEELEANATFAWNQGDVEAAERIARQALGRSSDATRAREILNRLAIPTGRPELQLATLDVNPVASVSERQYLIDAGRIALSWKLLRVAETYFERGVRLYPQETALQRQYVSISGLQLDAEEMQKRLTQWAKSSTPSPELIVMLLGLSSLDSRAAATAEDWLRLSVAADAADIRSRLGLARCLLIMGRFNECVQLLESASADAAVSILLAVAHASDGNTETAARLLPSAAPAELQAEYWYVKGLLAFEQSDWLTAEAAVSNSVRYSPLNKAYRSRHCELLRRLNRREEEQIEVEHLKTVIRIVQASSVANPVPEKNKLSELAGMCQDVGAKDIAQLIRQVIGE